MQITRQFCVESLGHDDFFVRSKMLTLFSHDGDQGLDVTKKVIEAVDRHGWADAFEWPHQITRLAQDTESVEWLLQEVFRSDEAAPDITMKAHLLRWFSQAPLSLVDQHSARLEEIPFWHRPDDVFKDSHHLGASQIASLRLELAQQSADVCRSHFEDTLQVIFQGTGFPHADVDRLNLIGERLVEVDKELGSEVGQWLEFDFRQRSSIEHWRAGAAIRLAGLLKLKGAAPRLVEMLGYDWDWWNEEIQEALIKMDSPETLDFLIEAYPRHPWSAKLFLAGAIEDLRFPGADRHVKKLLEAEEDGYLRTSLALGLLRYGTPEGIAAARSVYDEMPDDPDRFEIAEFLYAFQKMLGQDTPEMRKWRAQMEQFRRREEAMRSGLELELPKVKEAKVGRNDPCPCGSGKKFKKCCLAAMS